MKLTEAGIQKACIELLNAVGIPNFRMNAGDRFGTYKGKTWRIRGHEKGTADLLALPEVTVFIPMPEVGINHQGRSHPHMWALWLEIKRPGEKQTPEQRDFQYRMESRGHVYLVITDVSQLQDWLKQNGAR